MTNVKNYISKKRDKKLALKRHTPKNSLVTISLPCASCFFANNFVTKCWITIYGILIHKILHPYVISSICTIFINALTKSLLLWIKWLRVSFRYFMYKHPNAVLLRMQQPLCVATVYNCTHISEWSDYIIRLEMLHVTICHIITVIS